jgi:hypothetical protein
MTEAYFENRATVKVFFRNHGCVYEADIIPIALLPYKPGPQYEYNIPNSEIKKVAKPIWLSALGKHDVRECLLRQGLEPSDFITAATVHGEWKIKLHQGVVYAKRMVDITSEANPSKPYPARWERDLLFYSKLEKLKR